LFVKAYLSIGDISESLVQLDRQISLNTNNDTLLVRNYDCYQLKAIMLMCLNQCVQIEQFLLPILAGDYTQIVDNFTLDVILLLLSLKIPTH